MAKTTSTMGQLLLNNVLPAAYHIKEPTNKSQLNTRMTALARTNAPQYIETITNLKRVGDAVATDAGITVGLDDITPEYKRRDAILEPALAQIKRTQDPKKRIHLIQQTQQKLFTTAKEHPGELAAISRSGAKGNVNQLARTIVSPLAVTNDKEEIIPWIVSKSYAEGLKPADNWVALQEARRNSVESYTSVAEPGEVNKILVNNMSDQLITLTDCKTHNGVPMDVTDSNAIDRYRADTGDLVTPQLIQAWQKQGQKQIRVRSPMTCEAPHGICQKCYGLNSRGALPSIGHNVGVIAAHAMGETLTQTALNAKHATRTAHAQKAVLSSFEGFRQLTEIPQSFFNKATLAPLTGKVTQIEKAPQGGHYVFVEDQKHYIPPTLGVLVKKGTTVEAGDVLSDGIPKPDEIMHYKGLGAGRKYLVDSLHDWYTRNGVDLDKRHLELLAKTDLNHIRILDKDNDALHVMRGDIVDYNRFRAHVAEKAKTLPLNEALGETLGNNVLHYTVGTRLTPTLMQTLKTQGITHVPIAPRIPLHEPVMKPLSRAPLLHPDLLARLAHRNLKNVILEGAAFGEMSDIQGTHPIPAYVYGETFGQGPQGRY